LEITNKTIIFVSRKLKTNRIMNTYTDKELLTRFLIPDMMEELTLNEVSKSRRNEITKAFKKVLNDDQYYCISPMNFIKERLLKTYKSNGVVVPNFKFGYRGSTLYLCQGTVEFNGQTLNVVKQALNPKTWYEAQDSDSHLALYFSKKDIDKVCESH
jgi:hypothetical protein